MSQDSSGSTCSKLSLSPEAMEIMMKSLEDLTECGNYTQVMSRDGQSSGQTDLQFKLEDGDAMIHIDKYQISRTCGLALSSSQSQSAGDFMLSPLSASLQMACSGFTQHSMNTPPTSYYPDIALPSTTASLASDFVASTPNTVPAFSNPVGFLAIPAVSTPNTIPTFHNPVTVIPNPVLSTASCQLASTASPLLPTSVVDLVSNSQSPPDSATQICDAKPIQLHSLPSNTPFAGEYNFNVSLTVQCKETKAVDWTYSEQLKKLFVRFGVGCPLRFSTSHAPPSGTLLRAMPIFSRPQHVQEPVRRCPLHSGPSAASGGVPPGGAQSPSSHLVQCDHKLARYDEDPFTGFHSVVIPYEPPAAGNEWSTQSYQFMCYSSCPGGLNRRQTQLVFTLESVDGIVVGRQAIEVRICACPGRDRQAEEKNSTAARAAAAAKGGECKGSAAAEKVAVTSEILTVGPAAKRQRVGDETFSITVRGRENYEIMHRLRESLEIASAIPRTQFEQLRRQQENLRRNRPDIAPSPLPVNGSNQGASNQASYAPVGSSLLGHSAPSPSLGPGTFSSFPSNSEATRSQKPSTSSSLTVASWLSKHGLSSLTDSFHRQNLYYMQQLDRFGFDEFDRLGLDDSQTESVVVAFIRHRREVARNVVSPSTVAATSPCTDGSSNGSGSSLERGVPAAVAGSSTEDGVVASPPTYEVTRYTFKRVVTLPNKSPDSS